MAEISDALRKWRDLFDPLGNYYGNSVLTLVDGSETYESMYRAIISARSKGHYIYLLGWSCDERVGLEGDKNGNRIDSTSLEAVLKRTPREVQVRVMLWRNLFPGYGGDNKRAVKKINELPNAAAILDKRTPLLRNSHHQKVLLVNGSDGTIGFCGGVDIYPDRVLAMKPGGSDGSPQHDIHCRIQGPACLALIDVFDQRWRSHPDALAIDQDKTKGPLIWRDGSRFNARGSSFVRVTRTFNCVPLTQSTSDDAAGNDDPPDGDPSDPQVMKSVSKRACKKERSIAEVLFASIAKAETFIYVEEQYMIDLKVASALNQALGRGTDVIFLIPHSTITAAGMAKKRKAFIETALGPAAKKGTKNKRGTFRVYYLVNPQTGKIGEGCYVHAKTWVFDDEMVVIGSANCNRRGLSSDSEANVCILDTPYKGDCSAKALRKRLWVKHLGVEEDAVDQYDSAKSLKLWQEKRKTSWVREYDPATAKDPPDGNSDGDFEPAGYGVIDPDLDGLPPCSGNCC
jgi:phosphatidylserine/phosphatidylglycerophosphate/cardiolipin synthase-like enzyme